MTSPAPVAGARLRVLGAVLAAAAVAAAETVFAPGRNPTVASWWLLAAALALSLFWQTGLTLPGTASAAPPEPASRRRRLWGSLLAAAGALLWVWATCALYHNWIANFDRSWVGWLSATALLSVGLDLLAGRWGRPRGARRWWRLCLPLLVLLAVAAVYRLGNIATFPGEGYETQIEDVMTGMWGSQYLHGLRIRWEFLSWAWLSGFGIWLGGPTLLAMRVPFALMSVLKTAPLYIWLRLAAGPTGALVGTALYVCSRWDIVLSRIPNNQDGFVVATAFALLAGPVRRRRPSAYVWLGFLGGYVLYEYIAYRPLALFILAGAALAAVQRPPASWRSRVAGPLVIAALIGSMAAPLFLGRLKGNIETQYFDGFYRAGTYTTYYAAHDTWTNTVRKRVARAFDTAGLFFFHGDPSLVHNIGGRPQVDPVTAALLLFGIGFGLAHLLRGVYGLTAVAFLATLAGTLVVTGNFDIGRAGGTVPYVYALAGYGAAAVAAALEAAWGRTGRRLAVAALAAGVLAAGYLNTSFLLRYWSAPSVRIALRNNLPYLSAWLRENVRTGERVEGVMPGYTYVLGPNDAAWIRARDMPGIAALDVETMLRDWSAHPGKTALLVFDGEGTAALKDYLEWLLPGVHMTFAADPIHARGDLAWAHLGGPPALLAQRLKTWSCRGVRGEYDLVGATSAEVLVRTRAVVPLIDAATWPAAVRQTADRLGGRAKQVRVLLRSTFVVQQAGHYTFTLEAELGHAELHLDDGKAAAMGAFTTTLTAGTHDLTVDAAFPAGVLEPVLRLYWEGPDSHNQRELMPLYRLAVPDAACAGAAGAPPAVPPG